MNSFHPADLQSDAFRDDTPTLPPSSAPALNWADLRPLMTTRGNIQTLTTATTTVKLSSGSPWKVLTSSWCWRRGENTSHRCCGQFTPRVLLLTTWEPQLGHTHIYTWTHILRHTKNLILLTLVAEINAVRVTVFFFLTFREYFADFVILCFDSSVVSQFLRAHWCHRPKIEDPAVATKFHKVCVFVHFLHFISVSEAD